MINERTASCSRLPRCRDQSFQCGVGRRQKVVQYSPMRNHRLNGIGVAGRPLQRCEFVHQPILDFARGGQRGVERKAQHCGGKRRRSCNYRLMV